MRTSRVSLVEGDLFIEVAFKNINNPTDEFVLDVSILRAMQYRPSTLWINRKLIGVISSEQIAKLTNGQFKLIKAKYRIDPMSLATHESQKTIVPTKMLKNDQVMFQSVELMFATYGAHELIQDLIKHTPDEVLKKHSKEGYATLAFNNTPYEIYLKHPAWNNNVFAYSLIANIRHNKFTYDRVKRLNDQFLLPREESEDKFLITGGPWQGTPFTLEGYVLKNINSGDEYLWCITGASVDSSHPIMQLIDYQNIDNSDTDRKKDTIGVRAFVPVEPVIVDANPGRNDGELTSPFNTSLIGSTPIVFTRRMPKEKSSSGGNGGQLGGGGATMGSGNDPYGSNKGVASISTGTSQNDYFSDNMRLLVAAAKHLLVANKITSVEWIENHSCEAYPEPVCLYFNKTEHTKDWVVVAKKDNEESYRFVLLFKFELLNGQTVYMVELDTDLSCCVLFFRLYRKITPIVLSRVMQIIANKKGVMRHVGNDSKLARLGVFNDKNHWKKLDDQADADKWIDHVSRWLESRLVF
jgi:hypothetical protein